MRSWREWWPSLVVVALIAAVVVLCLMASSSSGARLDARPGFGSAQVLLARGSVDAVSASGIALDVALAQGTSGRDTLERLEYLGDRVTARRDLGQAYDASLAFDGSLWVVTTSVARHAPDAELWRLNPRTFAVRSRRVLPGSRSGLAGIGDQPLAAVGRRLWLAYGDRLVAIDPRTGALAAPRMIARARELGIIAGPGRTIVLSAGDGSGRGWIQERSAATGAFTTTSRSYAGVTLPRLGGVAGERLWISEATGMAGYVQAVSLRTLRPVATPHVPRSAANGIEARVVDGVLFVTQDAGGPSRNYCGDPLTGAARVSLPTAAQRSTVIAIASRRKIYFLGPPTQAAPSGPLLAAQVPAACR